MVPRGPLTFYTKNEEDNYKKTEYSGTMGGGQTFFVLYLYFNIYVLSNIPIKRRPFLEA